MIGNTRSRRPLGKEVIADIHRSTTSNIFKIKIYIVGCDRIAGKLHIGARKQGRTIDSGNRPDNITSNGHLNKIIVGHRGKISCCSRMIKVDTCSAAELVVSIELSSGQTRIGKNAGTKSYKIVVFYFQSCLIISRSSRNTEGTLSTNLVVGRRRQLRVEDIILNLSIEALDYRNLGSVREGNGTTNEFEPIDHYIICNIRYITYRKCAINNGLCNPCSSQRLC